MSDDEAGERRPTLKEILAGAPVWNAAGDAADDGAADEAAAALDVLLDARRREAEEDNRAAAARDAACEDGMGSGSGAAGAAAVAASGAAGAAGAAAAGAEAKVHTGGARKDNDGRPELSSSVASILGGIGQRIGLTGQKNGTGTVCAPGKAAAGDPTFLQRAQYTPLRLEYKERKQLHLLEAALSVSGYTDKLDTPTFFNQGKRIRAQLQVRTRAVCVFCLLHDD